jgi:hypothetical protein
VNERGFLSIQFMVPSGGEPAFVEFLLAPVEDMS